MARCTSSGRADRDVSGSRSLRTTTYEIPCRASVSARPADGRPAANSRCTESSARMVSGGVSGIESRTPHGLLPSTCSGSSWLLPHTWVANGAPGATSTRPRGRVLCSSSQSAASCQYCGIASNAPGGVSRPVQASDVPAASATSTTIADRHPLVAFGVGERLHPLAPRHAAGQRDSAQQMRQAEHQRQPEQRLQLVHVAQRGAACVEERLNLMGHRRSQPARVAERPAGRRRSAGSSTSRPRAGIVRIASPARPAAATSVVASTATDPVTSEAPAVAFGATNGVQLSVPRSISVSDSPLRGDAGGLDEVEERRADPAQHEQRDHPPRARPAPQHSSPPRGEPQPQPVRPVAGPPDHARPGSRSASRPR